jgi:hypothetical protein
VALRPADHDPGVTAERLASESGIVCGARAGRLRISLHVYNDGDDVDRVVDALKVSLTFPARSVSWIGPKSRCSPNGGLAASLGWSEHDAVLDGEHRRGSR